MGILCWVAFFNLTQDWGLVMWLVIGYFTGPILAAVLHAKIRGIVQMHCANDIREMKAGMYRLVDKDDSGTITLAELFKLLNEDLGIHVSMDDVYNIVADLDEDGNGELDEEEFAVMLDRLHVYDTSTLDEVIADESTGEGLDANTGVTLFESVFGVSSMFGRDRSDTGGSDDSGQGNLAEHLLDPRAC